jgi:hypothetical protein
MPSEGDSSIMSANSARLNMQSDLKNEKFNTAQK